MRNLIILTFLISTWTSINACSCFIRHPQTVYCDSDFVIKGTPVDMRENENEHIYTFEDVTFFKTNEKSELALKSEFFEISTPNNEAACGLYFQLGIEYVVSGEIYESKAFAHLCGFSRRWESITEFQRLGFAETYELGCSCDILRGVEEVEENPDVCVMESNYIHCYFNESACLRSDDNCEFTRSENLMQCLNAK